MTKVIVRRDGDGISNPVDRFYSDVFGMPGRWALDSACVPRVNIAETKDDVSLTFEVPGLNKDDLKVLVENRVLTVSGKRESRKEEKDANHILTEIDSGSFSRSFTLPDGLDTEKIKADYRNGMLTVTLAKKEEKKPKEIEVKVS
jgi:HSP20 family protein